MSYGEALFWCIVGGGAVAALWYFTIGPGASD